MGVIAWFMSRNLRARGDRPSRELSAEAGDSRLSRLSFDRFSQPPSLHAVRAALRRSDQPIMVEVDRLRSARNSGSHGRRVRRVRRVRSLGPRRLLAVDEHDVTTVALSSSSA